MATYNAREQEAIDAFRAYVAQRDLCVRGEAPWSSIAAWFTEDAVFIDPAWGRVEGRDEIAAFFGPAMAGLEGWDFPDEWTMVDGDRLVSFWWNRLPGADADGKPIQAPAFSVLHYAGEGLFDYELDVVNMAEVMELIISSGWMPGPGASAPEANPNRDVTPGRLATP
jgi:ketosteroid isomerase-like protein